MLYNFCTALYHLYHFCTISCTSCYTCTVFMLLFSLFIFILLCLLFDLTNFIAQSNLLLSNETYSTHCGIIKGRFFFVSVLSFPPTWLHAGSCEAGLVQQLSCPYAPQHFGMRRVWCRPSSAECCTGFTFGQGAQVVDGGRLKVTQGQDSFTVAVLQPSHDDEGMHWCGVLDNNGTIIKLAEGYFHGCELKGEVLVIGS